MQALTEWDVKYKRPGSTAPAQASPAPLRSSCIRDRYVGCLVPRESDVTVIAFIAHRVPDRLIRRTITGSLVPVGDTRLMRSESSIRRATGNDAPDLAELWIEFGRYYAELNP